MSDNFLDDYHESTAQEIIALRTERDAWHGVIHALREELFALRAKCDALERDAVRYRWLRQAPKNGSKRDWLYMPHTDEAIKESK